MEMHVWIHYFFTCTQNFHWIIHANDVLKVKKKKRVNNNIKNGLKIPQGYSEDIHRKSRYNTIDTKQTMVSQTEHFTENVFG